MTVFSPKRKAILNSVSLHHDHISQFEILQAQNDLEVKIVF